MSQWIAGTTIPLPPPERVRFFDVRSCAPTRCPRCASPMRDVLDGQACISCPWHAVIRESALDTLKHGYVAAHAAYEIDELDDRSGVSTRVFARARGRFCST